MLPPVVPLFWFASLFASSVLALRRTRLYGFSAMLLGYSAVMLVILE
jgi:hypothetical protein